MEAIQPNILDTPKYNGINLPAGAKIYLAIPYTGIEVRSYRIANHVASMLCAEGYIVFSPISMFHSIAVNHDLPTEFEFWKKIDTEFIKWCDYLMVVNPNTGDHKDQGIGLIQESKGVQFEMSLAKELHKPIITYLYGE